MLEKLHKINVKYTLAFILVALSLLGVVVVDSACWFSRYVNA